MKADLLREKFLDFFKSKKHKIVESDSLVPKDDPTVLFTPAGMNQFKREFLGFDAGFKRAATAQRCLRTDDLDKVGKTAGHHTFFEMLGNFSFGDYFKKEAIALAWEFLTAELKIKKEKLWVSVYQDDDKVYNIWKNFIGVPQEKIVKLGDKENFWPSEAKAKGPNGPCGPCSEIFFDQGEDIGCKRPDCNPSCDCGRFVEVWNLVFTQFNRKKGGILKPLPKKNIDTGMGLERLAAVMQGVYTNFETDLFQPIIKEIVQGLSPAGTVPERELIYAIADHIRAITFAIYDGVLPSNEARGYVVRKLIRKSVLHLRRLGIKKPFLYKLVPVVAGLMQAPYPRLVSRRENIAEIILAEEKNFIAVLNSSESLFQERFAKLVEKNDPEMAARIAFQLYDTYGIPLELTKGWLQRRAIKISESVFNAELNQAKMRSKLKTQMKGEVFADQGCYFDIKETKFLGYQDYSIKAKILKVIKDDAEAKIINKGDSATLILDKTVFYPESGGQIGDTGKFIKGKNVFAVQDTKKVGKCILHIGKVLDGSFRKNESVSARIDQNRRLSIARNHTATHLLQAALRKVLGLHARQQGSLVAESYLRFDFTHFKDIGKEELERIEEEVNSYILDNCPVSVKQMSLSEAQKSGALAFFAEKYESRTRVVSIDRVSLELCGGTHLSYTGQIGVFKILSESSVASGIRRIEAITGTFAYKLIKEEESILGELTFRLNVPQENLAQEIEKRLSRIKELEKQKSQQQLESVRGSLDNLIQNAQDINNTRLIAKVLEDADMDLLRRTVDMLKEKTNNAIIALAAKKENRALLVMGVTADLVEKGFDAAKLIKDCAGLLGGSGGGRKDFAQAGGNKPENFEAAFNALKNSIANLP